MFTAHNPRHRFIVEELYNENSIHAFSQFEEEGNIENFKDHIRFNDLAHDAFYAFGTPKTQNS